MYGHHTFYGSGLNWEIRIDIYTLLLLCVNRWVMRTHRIAQEPSGLGVLCLVAQSCLTLCDPVDCSPPGFSVHAILQARMLEWVAMPSSRDLPNPEIELGCLLHYRQILYQLSVQLRRPKMGRKFQKEGVCVYVWLVYLAVQNNIVEQLYSNKNLKKETKQKTLLLPTLNGKEFWEMSFSWASCWHITKPPKGPYHRYLLNLLCAQHRVSCFSFLISSIFTITPHVCLFVTSEKTEDKNSSSVTWPRSDEICL